MSDLNVPVIASILIAVLGSFAGLAALRKAGSESGKLTAEATGAIVEASGDIVALLRDQMNAMAAREQQRDDRILALEIAVGSWESWGERVLRVLDRALTMLEAEQRAKLELEVTKVKQTRPRRMGSPDQEERQ